MSYRRRELRNQSAEIKTKYFIFNSKSKIFELDLEIFGAIWLVENDNFDPRRRNVKKSINSRSSNRKWKWTDLNVAAVWRGPECPRGQKRFAAMDLASQWFSVDHRRDTDIPKQYPSNPKNRQPKNLTTIRKKSRHHIETKILIYQK